MAVRLSAWQELLAGTLGWLATHPDGKHNGHAASEGAEEEGDQGEDDVENGGRGLLSCSGALLGGEASAQEVAGKRGGFYLGKPAALGESATVVFLLALRSLDIVAHSTHCVLWGEGRGGERGRVTALLDTQTAARSHAQHEQLQNISPGKPDRFSPTKLKLS